MLSFGLIRRLETRSKSLNLPLSNICQFFWDTQKRRVTSIKLHNIPSDATSVYEQVLREGRER